MIGVLCLGLFVLACATVGLRLIWTAMHGGGGPAWSCGLGFSLIALLGYPLTQLAGVGRLPVGEIQHAVAAAGIVFTSAGLASFYAFTLVAFRSRTGWAWALAILAIAALGVTAFGEIGSLASADPSAPSKEVIDTWSNWISGLSTLCYAWIALEALPEWSRARKRVALGLGDPVVSNRILMWGLFGLSTTLLNIVLVVIRLSGGDAFGLPSQVAMAGFGLLSSLAVMLAFLPPKRWLERVRARAAQGVA